MNKYQELKSCYDRVINAVCKYNETIDKTKVEKFLLSISLRIWACNSFYAKEYGEALNILTGKQYTMEQILTAMFCCGDERREFSTPEFLKEITVSVQQKEIVNYIGDFLAAVALINGDFTIEEANCWNEIMEQLKERCLSSVAVSLVLSFNPKEHITAQNREGYYKSEKSLEKSKDNDSINLVKNEISNLHNKVNEIVDVINTTSKETNTTQTTIVQTLDEKSLEELLQELDCLVGLNKVKRDVHSLMNFIKVANLRKSKGLKVPTISYHLVFTGNPGTGKTTIARLVAQLYYKMGILAKGQLVETDRSALVAGYLGQTAIKTQKVIQEALGGVLFIDEAYSLAGEGEDSYGKEAIETLLKGMEDHRDNLVVIVAGYDELMHKFIDSNPGLRSRFNKFFQFPDYVGEELLKIFEHFCASNGYCISNEVAEKLLEQFCDMYEKREEHFGNARTVRNIFETAICCQADRIVSLSEIKEEDLIVLIESDIMQAVKEEILC